MILGNPRTRIANQHRHLAVVDAAFDLQGSLFTHGLDAVTDNVEESLTDLLGLCRDSRHRREPLREFHRVAEQ